jgi:ATP-dependent helicase/nuclease subunit A
MHRKAEPRIPDMSVAYEDFEELGDILKKARVEIVPSFVAEETRAAFQAHLQPALEEEAKRLLYVALTRAREKVIVEWPSHLAGNDKTYNWTLLAESAGMRIGKDSMEVNGKTFPCVVSTAETVVAPSVEESKGDAFAPLAVFGRRAVERRELPEGLTPEVVTPSLLRCEPDAAATKGLLEESYGPPLDAELEIAGAERGLALHRFFEVGSGLKGRAVLFERATGMKLDEEVLNRLANAAADFDRWLEGRFRPTRVLREVPLLGMDDRGSVVSGVLDLLVESAEGYWILDHKSDIVDERDARFGVYLPQLQAYSGLVRKAFPGKPVLGVGIHWISYGAACLLPGEKVS